MKYCCQDKKKEIIYMSEPSKRKFSRNYFEKGYTKKVISLNKQNLNKFA